MLSLILSLITLSICIWLVYRMGVQKGVESQQEIIHIYSERLNRLQDYVRNSPEYKAKKEAEAKQKWDRKISEAKEVFKNE